jgi:hypothetical protein
MAKNDGDVLDALDQAQGAPLRATENVKRARHAWDRQTRFSMLKVANVGLDADRVKTGGPAPLLRIKGSPMAPEIQSGIMLGKPWDDLTRDEQFRIVKAWIEQSGDAV